VPAEQPLPLRTTDAKVAPMEDSHTSTKFVEVDSVDETVDLARDRRG